MYLVIGLLLILIIIYTMTHPREGFSTSAPTMAEQREGNVTLTVPKTVEIAPPALRTEPAPHMPVGLLVSAPYQQVARNSPLPYQDPSLVKTTRQRILDAVEMLKGFLAFQANEIEYRSDPTIQLPLTTARADFQRLTDEANVLQRNPGLQPDMTEKEMDEIFSNLAFLQREVTLIGANRPFENTGLQNLEGFTDGNGATTTTTTTTTVTDFASEQDLTRFSERLDKEIRRLSESGTTDPIITARISSLTAIKTSIDEVIRHLQDGSMLSTDVPISKQDIENALPKLSDTKTALPSVLERLAQPKFMWMTLQGLEKGANGQEDAIPQNIKALFENYATEFMEGVSAAIGLGVGVKYTSKRDVEIEKARAESAKSTIATTGFPSDIDLNAIADGDLTQFASPYNSHNVGATNGKVAGAVTDRLGASDPRNGGRAPESQPASFDWKARAKHIETQIRKRGYKDSEYGLMPPNATVSAEFSWKGYAKMLCSRLQANMDTGLAQACGCPPNGWKGW